MTKANGVEFNVRFGLPHCGRLVFVPGILMAKHMSGHRYQAIGLRAGTKTIRFVPATVHAFPGMKKGPKLQKTGRLELYPRHFANVNADNFRVQPTVATLYPDGSFDVAIPSKPLAAKVLGPRKRKVKEPGIVVGYDLRAEDPLAVGDEELEFLRRNGVVSRDDTIEENSRFVAEREANNTEDELAAVVAQAMPSTGQEYALAQVEEPVKKGFWARFFGL